MQIACSFTCILQQFSSAKRLQVASEIMPEFEQPQGRFNFNFNLCARLTDKYIFSHLTVSCFQATGVSASDCSGIQTTCTAPRVHSQNTPWSNAEEQKRASTDTHNDVSTCTGVTASRQRLTSILLRRLLSYSFRQQFQYALFTYL